MSKRKVYLSIDAHARHCVLGVMSCTGTFLYSNRFDTCEKELIKSIKSVIVAILPIKCIINEWH